MKAPPLATLVGALLGLPIAAVTSSAAEPATAASPACTGFNGMTFVCGPMSAEDLVRLPGTPWLIASGLAQPPAPGRVQLIDTSTKKWHVAWPIGDQPRIAHDRAQFPECATSPDPKSFTAHGLSLRVLGPGRARLLVVNHGGREAIEFFDVESNDSGPPTLTWIGCVTMPTDTYVNSVVGLPDGSFLATKFYSISQGMNAIGTGALTGGVLEGAPGKPVTEIPGTALNGANGIEQAENGKLIYVAEWGKRQVVRFDRRKAPLKKDVIALDFSPDNLRWAANGSLLAAGQKLGPPGGGGGFALQGWGVASIAPATRVVTPLYAADATNPLQGVSVGVDVDGVLWVGPFRGDRVGYAPLPAGATKR